MNHKERKNVPKLIDYGRSFWDYFSKNAGLNTVTAAIVPAVVQAVSIGNVGVANSIQQSFDPATVAAIQHGGAGMITALVMVVLRVALAITRG